MKIRGRFIGILAVLGLLMALVPLATAGAVAGEVSLTGGADNKGLFFSDRTDFNIVTIDVEDADLSPARVGKARFTNENGPGFTLAAGVVGGEEEQVDEFDGGPNNPVCVDTETVDTQDGFGILDDTADTDEEMALDACASQGDAVLAAGGDGIYVDNDPDSDAQDEALDDNTYTFTLSKMARDANDDGVVNHEDITVVVDGDELDVNEQFTVGAPGGMGNGVATITLLFEPNNPENGDNVEITYEVSEYTFFGTTPIRLSGTQIHGGDDFDSANNQKQIDSVGVGAVTATSQFSTTPAAVVVTFVYHVLDEAEDYVNITSNTSLATGVERVMTGAETSARSNLFRSKIALFEGPDFTKIVNEITNLTNDGGADTVINIAELDNTNQLGDELFDRVTAAATKLGFTSHATDKAADLEAMLLPVTNGDTLTVGYVDESPSSTLVQTAEVDLEAPVVTLVEPGDGVYTDETLVTLSAEVVDSGAGVVQGDIRMVASGVSLGSPQRVPIVDGYRITSVPRSAIAEGAKTWFVTVVDKVGNVPAVDDTTTEDVNEGAKGAASDITFVATNPFKFWVDTQGPKLNAGKTGVALKNAGVTTGEDKGKEAETTNKRQWLRVVFNPGDGKAPLDADTVTASDFRVDGAEPVAAVINARPHEDAAKGTAVYLQVAEMDTDARPKVELVGEISDRAGNIRTDGTLTSISDGLAPVLEVTSSADIANDEIVLTISSSERLGLNPDVELTSTKPVKGDEEPASPTNLRVSLQTGALTTWTATYDNPAGAASKQYVWVEVSDQAGNSDTKGDASSESDLVSFQVDDAEPSLEFKSAGGTDLDDSDAKPEEGAVWIVAEFDEDEHADDKYLKVTVTALTLTNMDTEEVVTDDVEALFSGEVKCDDHKADADADPVPQDKCAEHTLAINLTPGMYNIEMTGVDSVGNEVTEDVDFEVTEAEPFELELRPGQNFISIPGMPMGDGGNINTLLADEAISSISTYDRSRELQGENPWLRSTKDLETGMFSGDITAIEPGKAYFINSTASVTLEITLQAAGDLPPTIPVRQGFNALGLWSVASDTDSNTKVEADLYFGSIGWSVAYNYDPTPGVGWVVIRKGEVYPDDHPTKAGDPVEIQAGKGYLVYALYDGVLTP